MTFSAIPKYNKRPLLELLHYVKGLQNSNYMYGYEYFNILPLMDNQIVINFRNYYMQEQHRRKESMYEYDYIRMNVPILSQKSGRSISPLKEGQYDAIEDKYAFGYFQNRSVQRHLQKLLKVQSSQNSCQNVKNLPPSTENRKIIGTLSDKISNIKHQSQPIKSERLTTVQTGKAFSVIKNRKRTESEKQFDALYPYKENLKLKSLEKLKANIERKEKLLKKAQEKELNLPRLKTLNDDRTIEHEHEITMRKLIEREDKRMATKMLMINRLKHKEFVSHISKRSQLSQREQPSVNDNIPYTIDA